MPIHRYLSEALYLVEELESALTDDDAEQCWKTLRSAGERFWLTFLHKKRSELLAYLEKTPAQRKKASAKYDGLHRLLIPLGALYYAKVGVVQYRAVIEMYENVPGNSYRKGLALAAETLNPWAWPVDPWPLRTPSPLKDTGE